MVNGKAEELEIHFVSEKIGEEDPTAGDAVAVVAVRGKVCKCSIRGRGIFKILDASEITEVDSSISIGEIVMAGLLPKNLDYYYYEGSLTTPDCDETVQWFVLKQTICVPTAYLAQLRNIEMDDAGNPLTFIFPCPERSQSKDSLHSQKGKLDRLNFPNQQSILDCLVTTM